MAGLHLSLVSAIAGAARDPPWSQAEPAGRPDRNADLYLSGNPARSGTGAASVSRAPRSSSLSLSPYRYSRDSGRNLAADPFRSASPATRLRHHHHRTRGVLHQL